MPDTIRHADLIGLESAALRRQFRADAYRGHTAGLAPGRLQCNLAIFETFGQLSLKAVAGMADMHFLQQHKQTDKIMFWAVIAIWGICVGNTVLWLR